VVNLNRQRVVNLPRREPIFTPAQGWSIWIGGDWSNGVVYPAEDKILIRRIINRQDRLSVAYCDEKLVFKKDINPFIPIDQRFQPLYLLGILCSRFISYLYLKSSSIATKDDFRQTTLAELRKLPIPVISEQDKRPIIENVAQILAIKNANPNADTSALEQEIDQLVYTLYGLTEEEIKIIEQSF